MQDDFRYKLLQVFFNFKYVKNRFQAYFMFQEYQENFNIVLGGRERRMEDLFTQTIRLIHERYIDELLEDEQALGGGGGVD